eukprot:SAG31_NODE_1341_length_8708_cov_10.945174_6_plen_169_part_00
MITVPAAQQIPDVYGIFTCVVNTINLPVARPPASEAAPCLSCAAAAQVPPNLPQQDLELRCANGSWIRRATTELLPLVRTPQGALAATTCGCTCDAGFTGTIAASFSTPYYTGSCVQCAAGFADTDSDATTDCVECAEGHYAAAGAVECTACALGTADTDTDVATECR